MEYKIKHLEMIQGVINRLSQCSFMLKGWRSRPVKWCIDDDTSHHRSVCQLSYQLLFP